MSDPILDMEGVPVVIEGKPLTLNSACLVALLVMPPGEQATLDAKVMRYRLAQRFAAANGALPELKAEEVVEVKKALGGYWNSPLVIGRVFEAIDPESVK